MNVLLRKIGKLEENIINCLKEEFGHKTASKAVLRAIKEYYPSKMISKKRDQELVNLRTTITKYQRFENDIKNLEPNKDQYKNQEDLYHKISNSLHELNNEENEEEYY